MDPRPGTLQNTQNEYYSWCMSRSTLHSINYCTPEVAFHIHQGTSQLQIHHAYDAVNTEEDLTAVDEGINVLD